MKRLVGFSLGVVLWLSTFLSASAQPPPFQLLERIAALESQIVALQSQVAALEASSVQNLSAYVRVDETDPSLPVVWFDGVNVKIVNGTGITGDNNNPPIINGLGNLIVGYDECRTGPGTVCFKTGSHNLIVGAEHNYSGAVSIIAGVSHTSDGLFASVLGGMDNQSSGFLTTVFGGIANRVTGVGGTITGGQLNLIDGADWASIAGGQNNTVSGWWGSVHGGRHNTASGNYSAVNGGSYNQAFGVDSTVGGGISRSAPSDGNWAAGSLIESN